MHQPSRWEPLLGGHDPCRKQVAPFPHVVNVATVVHAFAPVDTTKFPVEFPAGNTSLAAPALP